MQGVLAGKECAFCGIQRGGEAMVYEGKASVAFLDYRPVFLGHTLVVPRKHYENMDAMPDDELGPFFMEVKLVSRGVEIATKSDGSFVAINNKVSQSVPHMHVHVIPRKYKDGMHGFFWPRQPYKDKEEQERVRMAISDAIAELRDKDTKA